MSFEPPDGILDIGNATLRVGKLEVAETSGLNQGLQNIIKNDLLITENTEYIKDHKWGLKLPTTWVAEFEVKGHSGKYIDFNFYNENSASNAQGYNLTFKDTTMTLRYDGGNNLPITGDTVDSTLSSGDAGYGVATIPTIVGAYRKVNIFFERGVISVSIDGTRYLYFKESDGYNAVHGHPGVASRVVSTTGGAFVNVFIEQDADDSKFKNLRIVNGRFISDKTSNIAFIGGNLGVGVNSPKEALDIRGNMHLTRVSNVSQISVDSNVVTEYTGPHDRPLRKYPEVALTSASHGGYVANASSSFSSQPYINFDGNLASHWHSRFPYYSTSTGAYSPGTAADGQSPSGTLATNELVSGHQGEWVSIELPKKIKLEKLKVIGSTRLATVYQFPKDVVVAVSETGLSGSWSALETATLISQNVSNHSDTINITTQTAYYKYFALIVKSISTAGSHSAVEIAELEFYGHEEGSGSLDTTLKSVYNVPATTGTQLEVYYDGQDYTSGSTITDKVANANATISSGSDITFDSTYKAWVFGGDASRTQTIKTGTLPTSLTGGTNAKPEISAALWFNPTVWGDDVLFMISDPTFDNTDNQFLELRLNASQEYFIQIRDGQYAARYDAPGFSISSYNLPANNWYHLVLSISGKDPTERKMYLNGIECTYVSQDTAPSGVLNLPADSVLELGRRPNTGDANTVHNGSKEFFGSIANFRLYSKALNAGQVQELYDYQKDYFLGSKSQVTLYKGHLGVGVAEPSGQLELAGDERLQAYPPRGMAHPSGSAAADNNTAKNITYIEGHGEFKASASLRSRQDVDYDGHQPYNAFDYDGGNGNLNYTSGAFLIYGPGSGESVGYNKTTGYFEDNNYQLSASSGTPYGHWLQLEMPYKINVKSYFMTPASNDYWPQDWQIWASNDDNNWTHIHTYIGGTYDANPRYYTVAHTGHYKIYTMIVTRIKEGSTLDRLRIKELRYFGTPGPTTLDKGSLTLGRSLDVPRVSRYDVDTETPRPEKLVLDFDTTVNSSPTDISGKGNDGVFFGSASYSPADKAFKFDGTNDSIRGVISNPSGDWVHSISFWFKLGIDQSTISGRIDPFTIVRQGTGGVNRTTDLSSGDLTGHYSSCDFTSNQINWYFFGNDANFSISGIKANEWHHLTFAYEGGGAVASRHAFFDGVEFPNVGTNTANLDMFQNSILALGVDFGRVSSSPSYFNGQLSNFKIYNAYLEPSEVQKLYRLGRTGRSMVISDTAVGIGKVPEAQLDVRGIARMENLIYGSISHRLIDEAELYYDPTRAECQDGTLFATGNNTTINDIKGNHPGKLDLMTRFNYYWSSLGSSSFVRTSGNIDMRRDWTVMVWFGPSTTNNADVWRILGHGQPTTNKGLHVTGVDSSRVRYGMNSNDIDVGTSTGMARKREWFCMTMSYFHNGGVAGGCDKKIYQNERLIGHQQAGFGDGNHFSGGNSGGTGTISGHQPYNGDPTPLRFGATYGTGNNGQIYQQIGPCLMIPRFLGDGEVRSLYRHFAGAFPAQINVG